MGALPHAPRFVHPQEPPSGCEPDGPTSSAPITTHQARLVMVWQLRRSWRRGGVLLSPLAVDVDVLQRLWVGHHLRTRHAGEPHLLHRRRHEHQVRVVVRVHGIELVKQEVDRVLVWRRVVWLNRQHPHSGTLVVSTCEPVQVRATTPPDSCPSGMSYGDARPVHACGAPGTSETRRATELAMRVSPCPGAQAAA